MKTIHISHKKYGVHQCYFDDDKEELINQFKWRLHRSKSENLYARTNLRLSIDSPERRDGKRQTTICMHQLITVYPVSARRLELDHRDRNGLNNTGDNLRLCTRMQNLSNQASPSIVKSSQYKGVFWYKTTRKWKATIGVNNRLILLGKFDNELDAAKAYDDAARKYHGEFARVNFEPIQSTSATQSTDSRCRR